MSLMCSKIKLCLWLTLVSFISLALNFVLFRQQYNVNVGLYLFFSWMDFMYIVYVFVFWCASQWTQGPANTSRELHPNSKNSTPLPAVFLVMNIKVLACNLNRVHLFSKYWFFKIRILSFYHLLFYIQKYNLTVL